MTDVEVVCGGQPPERETGVHEGPSGRGSWECEPVFAVHEQRGQGDQSRNVLEWYCLPMLRAPAQPWTESGVVSGLSPGG